EDGIRDFHVTGVQTCALPISGAIPGFARTTTPGPYNARPVAACIVLKKSDFHYDLPPELIAQAPLAERSASRLLVVPPGGAAFEIGRASCRERGESSAARGVR